MYPSLRPNRSQGGDFVRFLPSRFSKTRTSRKKLTYLFVFRNILMVSYWRAIAISLPVVKLADTPSCGLPTFHGYCPEPKKSPPRAGKMRVNAFECSQTRFGVWGWLTTFRLAAQSVMEFILADRFSLLLFVNFRSFQFQVISKPAAGGAQRPSPPDPVLPASWRRFRARGRVARSGPRCLATARPRAGPGYRSGN